VWFGMLAAMELTEMGIWSLLNEGRAVRCDYTLTEREIACAGIMIY
jgi:hypothetical protein